MKIHGVIEARNDRILIKEIRERVRRMKTINETKREIC